MVRLGAIFALCTNWAAASAASDSPVEKVIQLISDLQAKISKEGEAETKAFKEFNKWCKRASADTGFQIKSATAQQASLEAAIAKSVSDSEEAESVIEDTVRTIAAADKDLDEATEIRKKENEEFKQTEAELMDGVDTLSRAINVIQREVAKNPALLQDNARNIQVLMKSLDIYITAAEVSLPDKQKLLNLVQSQGQDMSNSDESSEDSAQESKHQHEMEELGAPAAAAYKPHAGTIIDVLEDMKEKAEGELAEAQKAEGAAAHNFAMVKASLENQIAADNKEKSDATNRKHNAAEAKATAEADLEQTVKDLTNAHQNLETVKTDCLTAAADQESSEKGRAEELAVLAKAKQILAKGVQGAKEHAAAMFFQTGSVIAVQRSDSFQGTQQGARLALRSHTDLKNIELVVMLRRLAREQNSRALTQLASKVNAEFRFGLSGGEDPYAKVKQMISDMIAKLQQDAKIEGNHKAYCDEEMATTKDKQDELDHKIRRKTTKLEQEESKSAVLKTDQQQIAKDLSEIAAQQIEMDKARADEAAAYREAKADLETGIKAVQNALSMLRDYYAKDADPALLDLSAQPSPPGAATSIIALLEDVESDFSKALAEADMAEQTAISEYEAVSMENRVTKEIKQRDAKYKEKESSALALSSSELRSELDSMHEELSAVLEYTEKLKSMCVIKPEDFGERKARREAEIAGLREALRILDSEALLQKGRSKAMLLRGRLSHLRTQL